MPSPGKTPRGVRAKATRWERAFVIATLFATTGALLNPAARTSITTTSESLQDPRQALLFGLLYLVTLGVLLYRRLLLRVIRSVNPLLACLLVLALASTMWSEDPGLTLRRGVALVGTTLFAYYVVNRFTLTELLRLAGAAMMLLVASTLLSPALPVDHLDVQGGWKGILPTKNSLGRMMAITVMLAVLLARRRPHRIRWWVLAVGALVCLGLSRSITSVATLIVVLAALPSIRLFRRDALGGLGVLLLMAVVFAVAVGVGMTQLDEVLGLVGKDRTLTGRTHLWSVVSDMALDRSWWGYGYSAFWRGATGPSGLVWLIFAWQPPHAHNGFLDLWLQLGLVGLVLFVWLLLHGLSKAALLVSESSPESMWPFLYLIFVLMANITESMTLVSNSILTVLFITAIAYPTGRSPRPVAARSLAQSRLPSPPL